MKIHLTKLMIAAGFITLLSLIFITFFFVINEFNLLSKDHSGLFPANAQFPLKSCVNGTNRVVREFSLDEGKAESVPILTYHRIVKATKLGKRHFIDGELNPMIVLKEDFEQQMTFLKNNGYVTLTMAELYFFLTKKVEIPDKSVVLTFDDGYKDNFIEAYPILKNHDFNAVNFVITGAITSRTQPFTPKHVQYMSTKELTRACDIFEFQSHTYNYHRRETNAKNEDVAYLNSKSDKEVFKDINRSIHNLNGENLAFAYPYGEYSSSTIEILKDLQFKMAFTTENRTASQEDHIYEIPRFNMLAATTMDEFINYVTQ